MWNILAPIKNRIAHLFHSPTERRHALVGPANLWNMKREFQISFLKSAGLQPSHRLLDIGCGTLRGGIPIIRYLGIGNYTGIEARANVLKEAIQELADSGVENKKPRLLIANEIQEGSLPENFDFAWAFSVLIHMSDDILQNTLKMVSQHLSASGVFFANVNIAERHEGYWQGFPVVSRSLDFYQKECRAAGLSVEDIGCLADFNHHSGVDLQDQQRVLKITTA